MSAGAVRCAWCQRDTRPVWVHGHAQCEHCRTNIEPCCGGDELCPATGWTPPGGTAPTARGRD